MQLISHQCIHAICWYIVPLSFFLSFFRGLRQQHPRVQSRSGRPWGKHLANLSSSASRSASWPTCWALPVRSAFLASSTTSAKTTAPFSGRWGVNHTTTPMENFKTWLWHRTKYSKTSLSVFKTFHQPWFIFVSFTCKFWKILQNLTVKPHIVVFVKTNRLLLFFFTYCFFKSLSPWHWKLLLCIIVSPSWGLLVAWMHLYILKWQPRKLGFNVVLNNIKYSIQNMQLTKLKFWEERDS